MTLAENVSTVLATVATAEKTIDKLGQTTVIGVTKYVEADQARALFQAGITNLAENRTELFLDKHEKMSDLPITWHLIGTLQRRKVKDVINLVDYFHALDSIKLAREIDKRAEHVIKCFLQVNVSGEASKHGFSPDELDTVLSEISELDNVQIVGLMTMAPIDATNDELDDLFAKAKALQVSIAAKNLTNIPCTDLSMGMSRDYQTAIQHGATFVRIGSEFFK
ncbi:YggS family pyridoxal phosphate-dependent enzyme [Pseudolactococcus insecticola]|uniref:Pyridoxal phosphate homeostasis protein n=1 Tax=Pseudolactococcus insecticola TaxID=2709158 RepID=A0A6A0BA37_9LACT|nr:YggS family pyridoxal phosphate-dependent enzyme [Lactococcus insecticola]GFH41224.1 YggS family pyridoxal phosphate enzyme [Lactococcus insecticola]